MELPLPSLETIRAQRVAQRSRPVAVTPSSRRDKENIPAQVESAVSLFDYIYNYLIKSLIQRGSSKSEKSKVNIPDTVL